MGRHDLRAGYTGNYLWLTHWQPEIDNPRGRFDFQTRNITALLGGQANDRYNQFAAFLLGTPGTISKSVQVEEMTGREWQHGLFVRDRWTPTDKLTVDLGVRWEYYPIMTRADRGLERLDLPTLDVLVGGRGGNPEERRAGSGVGQHRAAPRPGLSPQREHGHPHRLRDHLQRHAVVASAARPVPGDDRRAVPGRQPVPAVRLAHHRHSDDSGAGYRQRQVPAAEHGAHPHA